VNIKEKWGPSMDIGVKLELYICMAEENGNKSSGQYKPRTRKEKKKKKTKNRNIFIITGTNNLIVVNLQIRHINKYKFAPSYGINSDIEGEKSQDTF